MAATKKTIGWAISMLSLAFILCLPVTPVFTAQLKLFLAVTAFVILIIAFDLIPLLCASILLPAMYILSGVAPVATAFSSWTNSTVWMILGGLIFSNVLNECGLLKRIAYWVIRKCGGTFNGAVFGCFFAGIILNIITFCNGWIVTCALVYGICVAMELKPSKESALICFAGAIGSNGSVVFLYHPGFASMFETGLREFIPDYTQSYFTPMIYNGAFVLWCIISFFILFKVLGTGKQNSSFNKEFFDEKYRELGELSRKEKIACVYVVILLAFLCTTKLTKIPAAYGFMILPYLMFLPVIGVGSQESIKQTNLSMIFFVATCLGIGAVGSSVGFGDYITSIAIPVLAGKSTLFVCGALLIFGTLANLVMTPLAMFGALTIPFAQVAIALGINPVAACMILLFSAEMVFLPYESSGNLIMYSYGLMPMKEFVKYNTMKTAISLVGFICVMYPLWRLLGLL